MQQDISPERIGIIVASMRAGGGERVALNLAEDFARRGIKTDLVLTEATGPLLSQIPPGVRVVDLGAGRARRARGPLRRYFRNERPSAVVSIGFETNILTMAAALGLRSRPCIVLSVHSTLSATLETLPPLMRFAIEAGTKLFYSRADRLVAVSEGAAEDLRATLGARSGRVVTIYNPILRDGVDPLASGVAERLPSVAAGTALIVTVGRLTQAKDQASLLRAFAIVSGKRPAHLVLVGDGELREALESLSRQLGLDDCVTFTGYVNNPYAYMRDADLFVLSSIWEGLPSVLIEAMATGTPVVATDCPHGPREILEHGRWGKLVPPRDPEALAEAMLEVLERGGVDARQRAADFTVKRSADQYLAVLRPPASSA